MVIHKSTFDKHIDIHILYYYIFRILELICEKDKEGNKKEDKGGREDEKTVECPLVDSHMENGWNIRFVGFLLDSVRKRPGLLSVP